MEAKFTFYEIVRVISYTRPGSEGAVLGMAQNDDGLWYYAIALYDDSNLVWNFREDELEPTGRHDRRESFYDEASIRVRVDPETGEGWIADEE